MPRVKWGAFVLRRGQHPGQRNWPGCLQTTLKFWFWQSEQQQCMKRKSAVQWKATQWQQSSRRCTRSACSHWGAPYTLSPSGLHGSVADGRARRCSAAGDSRQAGSRHVPVTRRRVCAERAYGAHSVRALRLFRRVRQSGKEQRAWTALCHRFAYQLCRVGVYRCWLGALVSTGRALSEWSHTLDLSPWKVSHVAC